MYRQRFYFNGMLRDTSKPRELSHLRTLLDRIQADWTKHAYTREQWAAHPRSNSFDPNNAILETIVRVSPDELTLTTTGNNHLCFINIEVKAGA